MIQNQLSTKIFLPIIRTLFVTNCIESLISNLIITQVTMIMYFTYQSSIKVHFRL